MDIEEVQRRRTTRLEDCFSKLVRLILNVEDADGIDEQYEARKTLIKELVSLEETLDDDQSLSYYDND